MNLNANGATALIDGVASMADLPDFWSSVDTCGEGRPSCRTCRQEGTCERCEDSWAAERGTSWCIALKGDADRCTRAAHIGPFCQHHLEKAREWFRQLDAAEGVRRAWVGEETPLADARRLVREARAVLSSAGDERVYFYELEGQGLVKIGTSRRVHVRVAAFRYGRGCTFPPGVDPSRGRLIGTTPGGVLLERHLHSTHRALRVVGEWFRLTPELAEEIGRMVEDQPDA